MSTLGQNLKHELRELIPVTVFFFGTFQLLALTQALMLEDIGRCEESLHPALRTGRGPSPRSAERSAISRCGRG